MVTTLLSVVLLAQTLPVRAEALPKLGTDRRAILASQRLLGHHAVEDTGSRIVFDGGPDGWAIVTRATYSFAANRLQHVTLETDKDASDVSNHERFWRLRQAIVAHNGTPAFDRVRDSDDAPLPTQIDETIWTDNGVDTTVTATYGRARALTVSVARDRDFTRELAEITDHNASAFAGNSALTLAIRAASERLLDDFGDLRLLEAGAKQKGRPIGVRLAALNLPDEVPSGTEAAVVERFNRFASGDWDVSAVTDASDADVDLVIDVEPLPASDGYVMRLLAQFAHGKNQGQVFYGATMVVR